MLFKNLRNHSGRKYSMNSVIVKVVQIFCLNFLDTSSDGKITSSLSHLLFEQDCLWKILEILYLSIHKFSFSSQTLYFSKQHTQILLELVDLKPVPLPHYLQRSLKLLLQNLRTPGNTVWKPVKHKLCQDSPSPKILWFKDCFETSTTNLILMESKISMPSNNCYSEENV